MALAGIIGQSVELENKKQSFKARFLNSRPGEMESIRFLFLNFVICKNLLLLCNYGLLCVD